MKRKQQQQLDFDDLGSQFASLLMDACDSREGGKALNILDFIRQELKLGIQLSVPQETVLRLFYNMPLEDEHQSLVDYWKKQGICTYHDVPKRNILCMESGRRSGKTLLASIICAYEFYKLCKLENPQKHYGIAWNTEIAILVIATSATQGERTIYSSVCGLIETSPYFKMLINKRNLSVNATKIVHHAKRLAIYAGNSKSASQVGGTLKALFLDEVARFKDVDGNSNAIELWHNLGASTLTFREEAILVAISSAWYEGDAIQQLREQNAYMPSAVTIKAASWDLNPTHASRDNPVIQFQYQSDPKKAALEYEGIRPSSEDPFFDVNEIKRAMRGRSTIKAHKDKRFLPDGRSLVVLNIQEVNPCNHATVLHIDPAVVRDGYALAYGHAEEDVVVIDGILAWEPEHNAPVSFDDVEQAILTIHRRRPLAAVTADHYASPQTIQRLCSRGIRSEIVFFSSRQQLQMYELLRHLFHQDRIVLPADSPWSSLLLRELSRVQLKNGKRIDHPKGESKDLADAVAGVCWKLQGREFAAQQKLLAKVGTLPAPLYSSNARKTVLRVIAEHRKQLRQNLKSDAKSRQFLN